MFNFLKKLRGKSRKQNFRLRDVHHTTPLHVTKMEQKIVILVEHFFVQYLGVMPKLSMRIPITTD